MMPREEEMFMQEAFQKLVDRGLLRQDELHRSTVTDADIAAFETKFDVKLPSIFKTYLKTYCYCFKAIAAPIPEDICAECIQDEDYDFEPQWLELFSMPKEAPMQPLYNWMEGFHGTIDFLELDKKLVRQFLPIGDWGWGWGPLCLDLSKPDDAVDINDESTWNLVWFDHEDMDWEKEYMDADGIIQGHLAAPDFKTLLEWYFCGKFDAAYNRQREESGDEPLNYSTLLER